MLQTDGAPWVVDFQEAGRSAVPLVGGKGAGLAELSRIEGVRVPPGFCITTAAFRLVVGQVPALDGLIDRLAALDANDGAALRGLSADIRHAIEAAAIPPELAGEITRRLAGLGHGCGLAVRSSATAEDLPTASFAGQHDSYLNLTRPAAVLNHIGRCWASLYTERAVAYRQRNGFDHRKVQMAVIVQRMVPAEASGVLFTADPVTGDRKVACIDAAAGLGEALVSGRINPDAFKVRDGQVVEMPGEACLTDAQAVRLAALGRRIEAHFGAPQDIEWCLDRDGFHIVQSRPITTLFPIPRAPDDGPRVYLSVGHREMMTDAWKALGLSLRQLNSPAGFYEAGGRLYVDVTARLATAEGRRALLGLAGKSDPLTGDALRTIIDRGFVPPETEETPAAAGKPAAPPPLEPDPAIVAGLIQASEASLAALKRDIATKRGADLLDFIRADIGELKRILFDPLSHRAIMASMEAVWQLNDQMQEWLGEKNAADVLAQSVSGNITSEMGLALLDVADVIRPHQQVVAFLEEGGDDGFLDALPGLPGGREARNAIQGFLDRYGMRCVGEIDITRPRWSERPSALLPMILANVRNFAPGEAGRRFERGLKEADAKAQELLARLRQLPDGEEKADQARAATERLRVFAGYREYPKYHMMCRYFVYKQALLEEARSLAKDGAIKQVEDIFHLTFGELREAVESRRVDAGLIAERKLAFAANQALTPPRVLTSEGEAVSGAYRREDLPPGALVGLAVSAGMVEGRARVVLDVADADLEPGDILVTPFTDPSWTPLFVAIKGLVTEVGGQMTHGAVIAREYGLPAVVGLENATRLIRDGERIRLHGSEGYVEILGSEGGS